MYSQNQKTSEYVPIKLASLRLNALKEFDLYLQVRDRSTTKFILYLYKQKPFTDEARSNLVNKGISTLYITTEDVDKYQQYIEANLDAIVEDNSISVEEKAKVVYNSSTYLAEKVFENPRSEFIGRYRDVVGHLTNLILSDEEAKKSLMLITSHDYYTYTHSVNVGVFGLALTKELFAKQTQHNFQKIGAGFFLHDIGKYNIPISIINKAGPLDDGEWKTMRDHPLVGYELLEELGALFLFVGLLASAAAA